jgi:hypothetical protein
MRRMGYVLVSLVLAMSLTGTTAMADIEWCAEDPVFQVNGANFRLTTRVAASASDVQGIAYVVTLPRDADASVHYPQGSRLPATVELRYTGAPSTGGTVEVSVAVTVSASADTDVRLDLAGPSVTAASFDGRTNKTLRAQFSAATR